LSILLKGKGGERPIAEENEKMRKYPPKVDGVDEESSIRKESDDKEEGTRTKDSEVFTGRNDFIETGAEIHAGNAGKRGKTVVF